MHLKPKLLSEYNSQKVKNIILMKINSGYMSTFYLTNKGHLRDDKVDSKENLGSRDFYSECKIRNKIAKLDTKLLSVLHGNKISPLGTEKEIIENQHILTILENCKMP